MLVNLLRSWRRVCTNPHTSVFASEAPDKSHLKTFISILLGAILGLALSLVIGQLTGVSSTGFMGLASVWTRNAKPPMGSWLIMVPVGVVYGFYVFQIAIWIFARILRGNGTFGTQAYLQSLIYAPLAIMQQIVLMIPGIGRWLFAVVALYSLWPTTTSLKATHTYSTFKAVITWILPIILNVVIYLIVVLIIGYFRQG